MRIMIVLAFFSLSLSAVDLDDGLVYTSFQLNKMADAAQARHAGFHFGPEKTIYSITQSVGTFFELEVPTNQHANIISFLQAEPGPQTFSKAHEDQIRQRIQRVPLILGTNTEGGQTNHLLFSYGLFHRTRFWKEMPPSWNPGKVAGSWVWDTWENRIQAIYIEEVFSPRPLPVECGKQVQYVRHMVDPKCRIYENPQTFNKASTDSSKMDQFMESVDIPKLTELNPDSSTSEEWYDRWGQNAAAMIAQQIIKDPEVERRFQEALEVALDGKSSYGHVFEWILIELERPTTALKLIRNRRHFASCGNDRTHIFRRLKIGRLASELGEWDLFMRTHLSLLESYLGPYPIEPKEERRDSVVAELEYLNIDSFALMLGNYWATQQNVDARYVPSPYRLAVAFSEMEDARAAESKLRDLCLNLKIDGFNRIRCLYLYVNFLCVKYPAPIYAAQLERLILDFEEQGLPQDHSQIQILKAYLEDLELP